MDKRTELKMEKINSTLKRVKNYIDHSLSLEDLMSSHFQYLKLIEVNIIPTVGEKQFYEYLKKVAVKSLNKGSIVTLRDLNCTSLCKVAFKSTSNIKSYLLKPYPNLFRILLKVVDDVKKEGKYNVESIIKMCKENMKNRTSLNTPLQLYKDNVDWKYLSFAESVLFPIVGEEEFYLYVKEFLVKGHDEGSINGYTPTEAFRLMVEGENSKVDSSITKCKERYPNLYNTVDLAIEDILSKGTEGKRKLVKAHLKNKIEGFNLFSQDEFLAYCKKLVHYEFNNQARKLNKVEFCRFLFQEEQLTKDSYNKMVSGTFIHHDTLNELLATEIINQVKYLKSWNEKTMKLEKDEWVVYFTRGLSLHSIKINFLLIHEKSLRDELKMFLLDSYNPSNSYATYKYFSNIIKGLKILQNNFRVRKIADIGRFQVAYLFQHLEHDNKYSVLTIKKSLGALSKFAEYILNKERYAFKPKENVFKTISVHNVDALTKSTEYIPEEVIEQLQLHIEELDPIYLLMYEISSYTGLRPKEVIELEIDCCEISKEYDGYVKLKYIPHKILNARRRRGLEDYNFVYIPLELYLKIQERINKNKELYIKFDLKYLFARRSNHGVFIPKTRDYCLAINKIIESHNICDIEGRQWHFTAKQVRKTVAVNLIENEATPQEVANQLGHLNVRTTEKYYIEVKKTKLAELNTEFFKKKFELDVGKENLDLYSEEERKQLYIDFCLNIREVEFGTCTKHPSEGPCGTRVGASSCVVCPKLCTGKKYIDKWEELRQSQMQIIDELHRIYNENGIKDYKDFIEYKKENTLLKRYDTVVQEIINSY